MITHKSIGYSGRLGNQMFQYAALMAVSIYKGHICYLPDNREIKFDGTFDTTNNKWIPYRLDLTDCFEINTLFKSDYHSKDFRFEMKRTYYEKDFSYNPEIFNIEDSTAIEGYFQSYKYFDMFRSQILKEFTFKPEILDKCKIEIAKYNNPVSIHVRRGDYVNHPGYWVITPEYISEALQYFTDKEYTFLIFSDDIEWCKQIFPEEVFFMEENTTFEDLCLMTLCEHNIICNSTFSWWGAYLNQNPQKKVIAPKEWFIPAKNLIDLYPEDWIII